MYNLYTVFLPINALRVSFFNLVPQRWMFIGGCAFIISFVQNHSTKRSISISNFYDLFCSNLAFIHQNQHFITVPSELFLSSEHIVTLNNRKRGKIQQKNQFSFYQYIHLKISAQAFNKRAARLFFNLSEGCAFIRRNAVHLFLGGSIFGGFYPFVVTQQIARKTTQNSQLRCRYQQLNQIQVFSGFFLTSYLLYQQCELY